MKNPIHLVHRLTAGAANDHRLAASGKFYMR